jgi:NAD(P)-dependent dehydrogenase (short-subunit alcohol dehydrogenase family)
MSKLIAIIGFGPGTATSVAERFAREGFSIAIVGRDEERLAAGVAALNARGATASGFPANAGDPESIRAAIRNIRSQMGSIDVLQWNVYGGLDAGDLLSAEPASVRAAFDATVVGLLAATTEALPDLKKNGGALLISNGAFGVLADEMDEIAVKQNSMGIAITSAAKNKLAGLLAHRLKSEGVYVGEVMVFGTIKNTPSADNNSIDPVRIADEYWSLYQAGDETRAEVKPANSAFDPEAFVRNAYAVAEHKDLDGWKSMFNADGIFVDESVKITYRDGDWDYPVKNYGTAFADMHRELYNLWTIGNTVFVRLALQGTHTGPLETPFGTIPPTGKKMDAPCVDIFELENGKIKKFDCYPEGSIILTQLGVIENLKEALEH